MNEVRVDKWLWAMRVFKTRTVATEACKKGRVFIGNTVAKPSRTIKVGDIVNVRKPPVTYSFRVLSTVARDPDVLRNEKAAILPSLPNRCLTVGIWISSMTRTTSEIYHCFTAIISSL